MSRTKEVAREFLRSKLLRYVPTGANEPLESDVAALAELLDEVASQAAALKQGDT